MIDKSESINELAGALSKFQASVTGAKKGGSNPHFRSHYARLEDAWEAAREALGTTGLALTQWPSGRDDSGEYIEVYTLLTHSSGQYLGRSIRVRCDDRQTGAQADGSATTYACRYAMLAALGLPPTDDDGTAASPQEKGPTPAAKPAPKAAPTKATELQHTQIKALIKALGVETPAEKTALCQKYAGCKPADLTSDGAVKLIAGIEEEIKALLASEAPQYEGEPS